MDIDVHKPQFKSKPEVITDPAFIERLKAKMLEWEQVRKAGADTISWWELLVKPGIKKLLIDKESLMIRKMDALTCFY